MRPAHSDEPVIDRLYPRLRPAGWPVMHQRWRRVLFLHWPLAPDALRALVPKDLALDLFEEAAWVSVVAFTVTRMRPSLLPPIPGVSEMHQINVRTYVHRDGVPGLWFLSLDATNPVAVWGARLTYRLPYYRARIDVSHMRGTVSFRCERTHGDAPPAMFDGAWHVGDRLPDPREGTLEFFLLERYVLYTSFGGRLARAKIHHRPWPLREAALSYFASTMLEAAGLPRPQESPWLHAQAVPFDVAIWAPTLIGAT